MPTNLSALAVGTRVTYRDPEAPRLPALAGEVTAVSEHAVTVRYDAHPHAPGLIGVDAAPLVLTVEDVAP